MPKESKWVEVAQGERNKPKEPTNNVMGQESPQEAQKRPNKHGSNNTTARIAEWYNRNGSKIMEGAKSGLKRESLQSNKAQPLKEASQQRMENQKTIHAIRGQR